MENKLLTDLEEKFCLVFACGPAPYNGNARKTYDLVFNGASGKLFNPSKTEIEAAPTKEISVSIAVRELMLRDDIRDRIDRLQSESLVNATTLRPRLTETLLKIVDECSTMHVTDRWGNVVSPAALRAVAVNAISRLTDMYGIKEDIAHKVMLEGADGEGITFNLIMPETSKDNNIENITE